jgi:hypothetical protein
LVRSHASFRAEFPKDRVGTAPPGEPIADLVIDYLTRSGFIVSNRTSTDYSHTFCIHAENRRFDAGIGLVDDGDREWLLYADSSISWFWRLIGKSDSSSHQKVLLAVHEALSTDQRISKLRWYTVDEWNTDPSGGTLKPVAI